ncbi:MAG: ROK family protein [Pirellulaceae bacterium]
MLKATDSAKPAYWLGFDLGGTKMLATVFDSDLRPLARRRKKTKGHNGVKAVMDRMVETVQEVLEEAQVEAGQLHAIGVGVPGPVDEDKGIVLEAANLGWKKVKLAELLETRVGCPAVVLNDVDAGVYGEYRFGAAKSARTVVGIFPGTGIGGGCVYAGEILHGRGKSCMEIGHVQVVPGGRICGCGLRGCLETEASRLAISADAAMAAFRGEAPHLLAAAGTNLAEIRSSVLAKAIEAGDKVVELIVRRAAGRLGVALATVIHLLAPDVVVLGGGLVEAMPALFVESVTESANRHVMPSFQDSFKVVPAKLGDDAVVAGVAAWSARQISQLAFPKS